MLMSERLQRSSKTSVFRFQ